MSGQKNQKNQSSGSGILKTAAVFAAGAIAGAGLAWFADEANQTRQNVTTQPSRTGSTNAAEDEEKDMKADGIIQLCEICFLPFEEIKAGGGQIMATPCGHVFCKKCIIESLRLRPDCPNCRQHVEPSDLQRLYL